MRINTSAHHTTAHPVIVPNCLVGDRYDGPNAVLAALPGPSVHLWSCRKIAKKGNPITLLHFKASVTTCNFCMAGAWGGVVSETLWLMHSTSPREILGMEIALAPMCTMSRA